MKFNIFDKVRHVDTGKIYEIAGTPDRGYTIEDGNRLAYLYIEPEQEDANYGLYTIWIRPQSEMEDGRFVLECAHVDEKIT